MIETRDLTRCYGPDTVVDRLNVHVPEGRIFGLIGPNGAGKTTTVRMLTTLLHPSAGTALVAGCDITKQAHGVRAVIGYVPQEAQADEALTGREHLILQARLHNMDRATMRQRIAEVLDLVDLTRDADKRALEYSGGMRKLLDIATGLIHRPRVLFLDEPTAGLDIVHRQRLLDYVRDLPGTGMTVFLTSHFLEEVDQLAACAALMDRGILVAHGSPADLKASVGTQVIDIVVGRIPAVVQDAVFRQLRALPVVRKLIVDGVRLKVFAERDDTLLEVIRQQMLDHHVDITSVTLAQPTLNDVFVFHTGDKDPQYEPA